MYSATCFFAFFSVSVRTTFSSLALPMYSSRTFFSKALNSAFFCWMRALLAAFCSGVSPSLALVSAMNASSFFCSVVMAMFILARVFLYRIRSSLMRSLYMSLSLSAFRSMASVICLPIFTMGFREDRGSWKIMPILWPRIL